MIRVLVWHEYRQEHTQEEVRAAYPEGIHTALAEGLREHADFAVRTATLDDPDHGLSEEALAETDVIVWWSHIAHADLSDEVALRVRQCVLSGMGLIVLHSAAMSKVFAGLMGTSGGMKWREAGEHERLWVIETGHPIAEGLPAQFVIPHEEMYGERFDIPAPEALVLLGWFPGGEVFRSGCCFTRGAGRIFYFQPGHETYPVYYQAEVRQVIANAVRWAKPTNGPSFGIANVQPLEPIKGE
jgi:trehalose utilization protein